MASPPRLTTILLAAPAQRATRAIATEYLDEASTRFDAFVADPSLGFHDVRVSVRRLRTWLRAFRPELDDTLRKKTQRRLKKLAQATNAPRDAEAVLEWIDAQTGFAPRENGGVRYFVERLTAEHNEADADARARLTKTFPAILAALSKQLRTYWLRCDVDEPAAPATMAVAMRDALAIQAARFARAIDRIDSADDAPRIHRVRIAAKRLRYLLETLDLPAATSLVEQLTMLQDTLGLSHDMHGLVNRIVRELGEVGARDARLTALHAVNDTEGGRARLASIRPGLTALAVRARSDDRNAYESFCTTWDADRVAQMTGDVGKVGDALVASHQQADG